MKKRKILYFDMDNVLVDFSSGIARLSEETLKDVYILSTAPWKNISAWSDKAAWVHKYFGEEKDSPFYKRLIISHHKNLNKGDFLIDDRTKNGAGEFEGELILFGSEKFPDWESVCDYLILCPQK